MTRLSNFPERLAAGVFILNAGVGKLRAEADTARSVHAMATGTYPFLARMEAEQFVRRLGAAEVALGSALVLPIVPDALAGAALSAFAGGLLGLYLHTPGMRAEGSLRPTQQGTPIAKDIWLLGIGLSLLADGLRTARRR
jgi:hypothetical protein